MVLMHSAFETFMVSKVKEILVFYSILALNHVSDM